MRHFYTLLFQLPVKNFHKSLYKFCTGQVENFFRGCCCCVTGCLMNENGKKDRKKRKNDLIVFLC